MKFFRFLFFIFLFSFSFLFLPSSVQAMDYMTGNTVYLSEDKTISGSLVATGQTIRIEGDVNGDLFCAGKDITITGVVRGDIICAGQAIDIATDVNGDIRVIGQTIELSGFVGGNMTSLGQIITVEKDSTIQGELMNWSEKLYIDGVVGSDVHGGSQYVTVDGNVGKNISLFSESLIITKSASISGNISYTSTEEATVDKSASIAGTITRVEPKKEPLAQSTKPSTKRTTTPNWGNGLYVIMSLLVGGFLMLFGKKSLDQSLNISQDKALVVFLYGLGTIIFVPLLILLFAVTIIGIPVSLLLVFFFILCYFAGRAIVAMIVGRVIAQRFAPSQKLSIGWNLVVGVLVSWILFSIPIIGGILSLITTMFGFGFVMLQLISHFSKK